MNILIVSGSRNPEGKTARAVQAVLEGAQKAGSQVETVLSAGTEHRAMPTVRPKRLGDL